MAFDMVIVGAGPSGLGAAIRAKQVAKNRNEELSICIVDKSEEIGDHSLSGNVFETRALDELLPNWRELDAPLVNPVKEEAFHLMTANTHFAIPNCILPSPLRNSGNHVISLGLLCKWLASHAESLGVEVLPGFPVKTALFDERDNSLVGVQTVDIGIDRNGQKKEDSFQPGVILKGKQIILAEGCRGSLSEDIIDRYNLRNESCPQQYGLGIKEVWEVDPSVFKEGKVVHTMGWPLGNWVYGGGFLYHMKPNLLHMGIVVGLDYKNPYVSPYHEFQKFKHHPSIRQLLEGGRCISYGARCLNEGGFQAIPKLCFPGGVLAGCSAGFMNVPKVKGTHTALKSGMVAGETIAKAILDDPHLEYGKELSKYQLNLEDSWVWRELARVRNIKPSFKYGGVLGCLGYSAFSMLISRGWEPWTFRWLKKDSETTGLKSDHKPIQYQKPDGKISFELLDNLAKSGTYHDHNQPSHLQIKPQMDDIPVSVSYEKYAGPESRFCPAGVYEYVTNEDSQSVKLQINAQNCIHCKCCSIKTPKEFIRWTVPQGGGPRYSAM